MMVVVVGRRLGTAWARCTMLTGSLDAVPDVKQILVNRKSTQHSRQAIDGSSK